MRQRLGHIVPTLNFATCCRGRSTINLVVGHKVFVTTLPGFAISQFSDAVPDGISARSIKSTGIVPHDARIGGTPDTRPIGETAFVATDVLRGITFIGNELGPLHLNKGTPLPHRAFRPLFCPRGRLFLYIIISAVSIVAVCEKNEAIEEDSRDEEFTNY